MAENQSDFPEADRIELTSRQRQVIEIFKTAKSRKYPLGNWFLGAIYAAKNTHNPDRFAQAAQSLRELLEKLPRVFVESAAQESRPNFQGMRGNLYSRLCSDKERYEREWKGKTIDAGLDETIRGLDRYLELNHTPTRKEQIHSVMNKLDPMHDSLDQGIRAEKSEQFHSLWKAFEGLAHHNSNDDEDFFWEQLALAERLIIDLLAPSTAQDQGKIKAISSMQQPEPSDIEQLIELVKRRGANYDFFFKTAVSSVWIDPLVANGFFRNPPKIEAAGDGRIIAPHWWPIFYLRNVATQSPAQVVDIVLGLQETDNPQILREIFALACDLPDVSLSLRLKPLIKNYLQSPYRSGEDELIVKILQKWGRERGPSRVAAQDIMQYVIAFEPDPQENEKRSRHIANPEAWNTSLEPAPRFHQWDYQKILEKGVRPLAENEPYEVACNLIDATASMIRMRTHQREFDEREHEDLSEIWCRRLDRSDRNHQDPKRNLVHTLTHACDEVYRKAPKSIEALDQALRNQHWKVFKRLRQHLYGSHPNDQTLPWIRELTLSHEDYEKWPHHYEFQRMIRIAAEHFSHSLLSDADKTRIFEAIASGPSKESFRAWIGNQYSEETFRKHQRYFHLKQLRPFAPLLSGETRRYYEELATEFQDDPITDDNYSPVGEVGSGWVTHRSPKSVEELDTFGDEGLLNYLNTWVEQQRDKDDWLIEINVPALADEFQALFKTKIIANDEHLNFWMTQRDRIARPIYVAAMVKSMQELVKDKDFANLDQWVEFCSWILSHKDTDRGEDQPEPTDESSDNPSWRSSRRAVVDFIETCLKEGVDAPFAARDGLASLLQYACTQFDWRLDCDQPVLLNRDDPITEAINNTRSRALESLVNFGFWVRRHLPEDPVPEVTDIFSARVGSGAEFPLTGPEHALIGMNFGNLCALNRDWAAEQKEVLFPQADKSLWRDAFGSFIRFNRPANVTFEILRGDFEFALGNLNILSATKDSDEELVDRLGQHLFSYYLWQVYPLTGDESLLERFYSKTSADRQRWAHLFNHVGHALSNSGKHVDSGLVDRAIAYFDWRLEASEPKELQEFTFWLVAECLEAEWRLHSYSNILDLGIGKDGGLSMEVRALNKLLPDHPSLVVECFAKITDTVHQGAQIYISTDEAKPIMKAGLDAEDPVARANAERARENLLRVGRFDFLDMN